MEWNPAAEEIFGWSASEAVGKHPYSFLIPDEIKPCIDKYWAKLLSGEVRYSSNENLSKDGSLLTCEWYNIPLHDPDGKIIGVLSMVKDVTSRMKHEAALWKIADVLSFVNGESFFQTLACSLAEFTKIEYVIIAEISVEDPAKIRTVAFFNNGTLSEDFECILAGTPCEGVVEKLGKECFFPSNVREEFPNDRMLQKMGINGYLGVSLRNTAGEVIGIMGLMTCQSFEQINEAIAMLRLFAVRAASEMERRCVKALQMPHSSTRSWLTMHIAGNFGFPRIKILYMYLPRVCGLLAMVRKSS